MLSVTSGYFYLTKSLSDIPVTPGEEIRMDAIDSNKNMIRSLVCPHCTKLCFLFCHQRRDLLSLPGALISCYWDKKWEVSSSNRTEAKIKTQKGSKVRRSIVQV